MNILVLVVFCFFLFDIVVSYLNNHNKECWNIHTQISLILHHLICIFVIVAWLSNNKYILGVECLLISGLLIHWIFNIDIMKSQHINKNCGTNRLTLYMNDILPISSKQLLSIKIIILLLILIICIKKLIK